MQLVNMANAMHIKYLDRLMVVFRENEFNVARKNETEKAQKIKTHSHRERDESRDMRKWKSGNSVENIPLKRFRTPPPTAAADCIQLTE